MPYYQTEEVRAARDAVKACTRRLVTTAMRDSGVTAKQVAGALDCSLKLAQRLTQQTGLDDAVQISYTHLLMLSRSLETRELARLLLVPILTEADSHQLRVADLDRMSERPDYADAARKTLQAVNERLWPGLMPGAISVPSPGLEEQHPANENDDDVKKENR